MPYFTDRARRALKLAQEKAKRLRQDQVDTQHVLFGIILEGGGVACTVLSNLLGMSLDETGAALEKILQAGSARPSSGELPYTSRAKRVLDLAMREAVALNHHHVGTEHLLLGLLAEGRGVAARVLGDRGVTLAKARSETRRLFGGSPADSEEGPVESGTRSPRDESRAARYTTGFAVEIDDRSSRSIYEQIIHQVQEAVATGRLNPGDRLPPVRGLADQLDIAPGTVARAYSELERLGVVVTEGARGTRVAERTPVQAALKAHTATLVALLRPAVVAAFHLGASGAQLRKALEEAMEGIFTG